MVEEVLYDAGRTIDVHLDGWSSTTDWNFAVEIPALKSVRGVYCMGMLALGTGKAKPGIKFLSVMCVCVYIYIYVYCSRL